MCKRTTDNDRATGDLRKSSARPTRRQLNSWFLSRGAPIRSLEMKSATTCIAVAVIFACFCSAQATSQPQQLDIPVAWTSLVAWPIASPQPVLASDGKVHLVYELFVMNVSSSVMTLDRLETLDASKGDAVVNTKSGDEIVRALQGADLEATIRAFPQGAPRRSSLSS